MKFGLQKKITLFITLLLFALAVLLSIINVTFQQKSVQQRMDEKVMAVGSLLKLSATNPLNFLRMDQLRLLLADVLNQKDAIYAYAFDEKGRILSDGTKENQYRDEILTDIISQRAVSIDTRLIQYTQDILDTTEPIYLGDKKIGGVRIGFSLDHMKADIASVQRRNLILCLVVIFIGAVFAYILTRRITIPISKLLVGIESIAKGNFSSRIQIKTKDELGKLADSFNLMGEKLEKTTVSKDYVDNIIQTMVDALIVLEPNGKIKTVNNATIRLLGFNESELIGSDASLLFMEGKDVPFKSAQLQKLIEKGSIRDYEINYKTKVGENIPVSFSSSILKDKDGKLIGVVGVAKDMREIKRLMEKERKLAAAEATAEVEKKKSEELQKAQNDLEKRAAELARSNKELEEFAYIASHDLQEPLRKVKTFGDRLIQKYGKVIGDQGQDYLKRMENATSRMQTLINDLLTYSRVTSKAQPFTPVNLNDVVGEVLSDLEIKIEEANAQIHVDDLPAIEADPLQMRQLFQNLIGNALKFSKPEVPPVVEIRSALKSPQGKDVDEESLMNECVRVIKVTDNGIGFEERHKERIFNVFQCLHGRKEYAGTGIGLAVCRKIVTRHGGSIEAEGTPGKGSTFIITLPVIQPKEEKKGDV